MTLDIGGGYENRNHPVVVGRPVAAIGERAIFV